MELENWGLKLELKIQVKNQIEIENKNVHANSSRNQQTLHKFCSPIKKSKKF